MKKAYLLAYSGLTLARTAIKSWADASPLVVTWRYDLPNTYYLISEATAKELADELRETVSFPVLKRFIITELTDNKQGWLPAETWYLLRHMRLKPKDE